MLMIRLYQNVKSRTINFYKWFLHLIWFSLFVDFLKAAFLLQSYGFARQENMESRYFILSRFLLAFPTFQDFSMKVFILLTCYPIIIALELYFALSVALLNKGISFSSTYDVDSVANDLNILCVYHWLFELHLQCLSLIQWHQLENVHYSI